MLGAMVVELKRQLGAGLHHDVLHLHARAIVDRAIGAPGAMDQRMGGELAAAGALEPDEAETLRRAWRLYTRLGQIVRLCAGDTFVPEASPEPLRRLLAASVDCPDFERLRAEVADSEYVVRRIFRKVIDRTQREH
jgi:hypothetical protein